MAIRIKLELDADTQRLTAAVQQALSKGFGGGSASGLATNPSSIIRQLQGRQGDGMRGYRDPMGGTSLPGTPDFLTTRGQAFFRSSRIPPTIASVQAASAAQRASFLKNVGFAGIPLLSPGSLLGNLFATRQIFSGLSGPVGQGLLGKGGIGGTAGTAAATGGIMAILLAVGTALKGLEAAIRGTIRAYDEARRLYAKSLLSGLGTQFTIGRANLASVLGVSEEEVYRFGAAIGILGPKLKWASDTMAKTTPNLTSVSWEFEILKKNLQAAFFTLANDAAPAIRKFTEALSELTIEATNFYEAHKKQAGLSFRILAAIQSSGLTEVARWLVKPLGKLGTDMGAAPNPSGMMKQLPVSAFERMGFITGNIGGNHDYSRRIAAATEKTAKAVTSLVQKSGALPRGEFGMFNVTSNP